MIPSSRGAAVRYAVTLPPFEAWSDPHAIMTMAVEAERAGRDGFFLWDHVTWNPAWGSPPAMADAWTCVALAATVTSRLRLGAMVTPLARRRVEHFARQLTTIDRIAIGPSRSASGSATIRSTPHSVKSCVIEVRGSTTRSKCCARCCRAKRSSTEAVIYVSTRRRCVRYRFSRQSRFGSLGDGRTHARSNGPVGSTV